MFTRGGQDVEETVISDPLGMLEDMERVDRTYTSVQPMPKDVQGKYLNSALSTPYNNPETRDDSKDTDEDTDAYIPEGQVQDHEHEPVVPARGPAEVTPAVKTSDRVRNQPERYKR